MPWHPPVVEVASATHGVSRPGASPRVTPLLVSTFLLLALAMHVCNPPVVRRSRCGRACVIRVSVVVGVVMFGVTTLGGAWRNTGR